MKAILINVDKQTIEYVYKKDDHYTNIYAMIGNDCTCFAAPVTLGNGDTLYCDDEGLLKPIYGGIMMAGWNYPLVGNIVVLGSDEEGDTIDVQTTIEELKRGIKFLTKEEIYEYGLY